MSHENSSLDPLGQLTELVVHRIHAMKQKDKFKKFQPLRGPRQNPYSKERSSRIKVASNHIHNRSQSLVDNRGNDEGERSMIHKRSVIVTEENIQLPKIVFHQKSFEDKYKGELREFRKFYRHKRQLEDKHISQSRILDEVLQEQSDLISFREAEYISQNNSVTENKNDQKAKEVWDRSNMREGTSHMN
jgi:hypothetical protein